MWYILRKVDHSDPSFVAADLHLMGNRVMTLLGSRVYENKVTTIYRWTDQHPKLKHWYLGYGFGVSGVV